jgi:hypothetical protein
MFSWGGTRTTLAGWEWITKRPSGQRVLRGKRSPFHRNIGSVRKRGYKKRVSEDRQYRD